MTEQEQDIDIRGLIALWQYMSGYPSTESDYCVNIKLQESGYRTLSSMFSLLQGFTRYTFHTYMS